MIDDPYVTKTDARRVAKVHLTVPTSEIQTVMGPAIREVYDALAAQGVSPAGPWLTYHLRQPTDVFDFDACVPVSQDVTAVGRVRPGELPAATVARTTYHGPYEGLATAWGEFMGWISAQGHTPREALWEVYVVGPESGLDASEWRTELNRPLLR